MQKIRELQLILAWHRLQKLAAESAMLGMVIMDMCAMVAYLNGSIGLFSMVCGFLLELLLANTLFGFLEIEEKYIDYLSDELKAEITRQSNIRRYV